jgi:hypothetical protein
MTASPKLTRFFQSEVTIRRLQLGAGAAAIGLICWRLQFATRSICCGDYDGYYHIMWSRILWQGLRAHHLPAFTWLPLTTLSPKDYVDHHFLFHIVQIPFTWFRDLRLGAKVEATIFAGFALFLCYWFMVQQRIRYVLIWLVALLACSWPFLFRLNMGKAPPFAIIFLIAGIYLLFRKQYWPLLPLAFLFTLTYDMFVLLIVAAIAWTIAIGWAERRFEWRPIVFVLGGTVAGFVINPYFPRNLHLFYEHLKVKMTLRDFSTKVGNEWYPYETWDLLKNSVVACVAMVIGYVAFDPTDRKRSHHSLFFLIFSTVLLLMTAKWQRSVEYWPPFAVLFAAFSLQPWIEGARSTFTTLPADILDELRPFLDRPTKPSVVERHGGWWRLAIAGAVFMALSVVLVLNLRAANKEIADSDPPDHYQRGMEWVRTHVPPGEIIFNSNWSDFPRLFYFDPTHRYVSGLDPTYLYDRNPGLSALYDRITLGDEEDPGPLIRDHFGSRYVFTDTEEVHSALYTNALNSGWFEVVYDDKKCAVLHIRDQKIEPPPDQEEPDQSDQGDNGNVNAKPN